MRHKMMYTGIALLVVALAASACAPQQEIPLTAPIDEEDLPAAAMAARQQLSEIVETPPEEINVVSFEEMEWPNACLGLEEEGEMCAQVITPGWRVVLDVNGEQYTLRTDEEGEVVRLEETE
jgi:hypothetical protein